ncbi:MAG: hypothetical protein IJ409_09990 [Lachnospiraceae bacterium]|nr:hypothetical protein [Lachnospiraceae bacterium]
MKKVTVRMYSVIAFVVLPVVIVLVAILGFLFVRNELTAPTVDQDEVTDSTQTGELYEVLFIEEGDDIYAIYAIGDFYRFDKENELIAFHGFDREEISDTIRSCDYGAYAASYWQGEGQSFDFSVTRDFEEYLEEIQNRTYVEGKEPDWEDITDDFSNVTLYDLSDYKGYEHRYNNGIGIVVILAFGAIGGITLFVLVIELLIAIILKLTVFKVKKE